MYQKELIQLLLAAALNGTDKTFSAETPRAAPLVYLPTGAGKTRLASTLMLSWIQHFPGARCAFLVNRRTLLRQGHAAISAAAERWQDTQAESSDTAMCAQPPEVGIIGGGCDRLVHAPLLVCSVQALQAADRRRAHHAPPPQRAESPLSEDGSCAGTEEDDLPGAASAPSEVIKHSTHSHDEAAADPPPTDPSSPPVPTFDLVIVDEAHAAYAKQYRAMLQRFRADGAFVVGLTATPLRSNVSPPPTAASPLPPPRQQPTR